MRYLLDTCIVSLFARGHERVLAEVKRHAPSDVARSGQLPFLGLTLSNE